MNSANKTFMRITNKDIYCKLLTLEDNFTSQKSQIKLNTWLGSTAITFCLAIITMAKFL